MITLPQHIRRKIQNIELGFHRQGDRFHSYTRSLNRLQNLQNQLRNQKGDLFTSKDDYINIFNIMTAIINLCDELYYPHLRAVFTDVEIEEELSFALNHARLVHPRMKKEIDIIIKFLEDVPYSSWGQTDEFDDFKIFKLVKTKYQWNKIMAKTNGRDFSTGNTCPDFKHLKIGYSYNETSYYNPTGIAAKAKDHIIETYGQDFFESNRKAFKQWFKFGRTGTYYIYVPK